MFTLLIYVYAVELTIVLYAWKITAQTNKKTVHMIDSMEIDFNYS